MRPLPRLSGTQKKGARKRTGFRGGRGLQAFEGHQSRSPARFAEHRFQTWQDKAGNALPITDTDIGFRGSTGATVSFADLTQTQGETNPESLNGGTLQANLIIPEPCHFLNPALGAMATIRPTSTRLNGAVAAIRASWMTDCSSGRRIPPS